jgi:hypothetical protein
MSRKSSSKAAARRERLREARRLAAIDAAPSLELAPVVVPVTAAEPQGPISKAALRERIRELIESRELLLPPPRPTTFEGVRFQNAIRAGLKAGILEASLPK